LDEIDILAPLLKPVAEEPNTFIGWINKQLDKI
jgi:hypothetical protein